MVKLTTVYAQMTTVSNLLRPGGLPAIWLFIFSTWFTQDPVTQEAYKLVPPVQDSESSIPSDEDVEILMRGPVHEAFADVHVTDPKPGKLIAEPPPPPVDELPPEFKPEGSNVVWIPGYWAWLDEEQRYVWVTGFWRDAPPNQRWEPGYWAEESEGHRWISGYWVPVDTPEVEYLPAPPTSLENGPSTAKPTENHFYIPGNWEYQNSQFAWKAGYWSPCYDNWIWIPARYIWTQRGCIYRPGYWDRVLSQRGTLFAPVHFRRPLHAHRAFRFTPTCVVTSDYSLLVHLFVRPNCHHYYFGDWYTHSLQPRHSFRGWYDYCRGGRHYDPLYHYYLRRQSFTANLSVTSWVRDYHQFYCDNPLYRPRHTFRAQQSFVIGHHHQDHLRQLHGFSRAELLRHSVLGRNFQDCLAESQRNRVDGLRNAHHHAAGGRHSSDLLGNRARYQRLTTSQRERICLDAQTVQRNSRQRRLREAQRRHQLRDAQHSKQAAVDQDQHGSGNPGQMLNRTSLNSKTVVDAPVKEKPGIPAQQALAEQRKRMNEARKRLVDRQPTYDDIRDYARQVRRTRDLENSNTTSASTGAALRNQPANAAERTRAIRDKQQALSKQQQLAREQEIRQSQARQQRLQQRQQQRLQQRQLERRRELQSQDSKTRQQPAADLASQLAAKQLAAKQLAAKQLAAKQLAAKQQAAQQQAARIRAAQQQAGHNQAARNQAARNQAARNQAAQQQAAKQLAAKQQAAQVRAAQQRAAKQQAAQQQAAQQRAAQQQAAQKHAAQQQAAQQRRAAQQRAAQRKAAQQRAAQQRNKNRKNKGQ